MQRYVLMNSKPNLAKVLLGAGFNEYGSQIKFVNLRFLKK